MKLAATMVCALGLLLIGPATAEQPPADQQSLDAQYRAAQLDAALATLRLGLVQVQVRMQNGQFAQARQDLDRARELMGSLAAQTDLTAYRQVADRLGQELAKAEGPQRRMTDVKAPAGAAPAATTDQTGPGYGDPKLVDPRQPGLAGQVDLAVEQAKLAQEHSLTNVPGSRTELTTDPAVVKQRTLDHQTAWDQGRYAPAAGLIDVGKMLELDRERVHYQYVKMLIRDGARRDELMHVNEATIPPPHVLNYPAEWAEITKARAKYADGMLWQSPPFKDADGQEKTVAVYDVSDLLFVPIYPGPSQYNSADRPNVLSFWAHQDRQHDLFTHPPFYAPAYYGWGVGGGGGAPGYTVPGAGGAAGGYGYRVTDIIPYIYYYPFEADPIYQYRLAQKRARLLFAINQLMSATGPQPGLAPTAPSAGPTTPPAVPPAVPPATPTTPPTY